MPRKKVLAGFALLIALLVGCQGATGIKGIQSNDPVERGCGYIAAAIVTSAVIRAFFNE